MQYASAQGSKLKGTVPTAVSFTVLGPFQKICWHTWRPELTHYLLSDKRHAYSKMEIHIIPIFYFCFTFSWDVLVQINWLRCGSFRHLKGSNRPMR